MRIILKPMGLLVVVGTITALSTLLYVQSRKPGAAAPPTAAAPMAPTAAPLLPALADSVVYRDGVENGWETFGWAKELDWAEAAHARGGSGTCIAARPANFEAVYLHHAGVDTSRYDRVTFFLHGGEEGGQTLRATVIVNENDNTPVSLTLKPLPAGRWAPVTLKLKDFFAAGEGRDVTGFWVMNTSGKTADTFYIDDIRLLAPGEQAPAE